MEFHHVMVSTVFHRDPSCLVGQMEFHVMTSTYPLTGFHRVGRWKSADGFQHVCFSSTC
jgi:hypothetical protein